MTGLVECVEVFYKKHCLSVFYHPAGLLCGAKQGLYGEFFGDFKERQHSVGMATKVFHVFELSSRALTNLCVRRIEPSRDKRHDAGGGFDGERGDAHEKKFCEENDDE